MNNKQRTIKGFTNIELAVAIAVSTIVIVGIGVILVDSQRGWNLMYNRIYSDVITDSYVARKMFDSVIRKASKASLLVDGSGSWVEVNYYSDANSAVVDRYARFFESSGDLNIEYGQLNPRETLSTQTICKNVQSCVFKSSGRSAQMILTLDDGSLTTTTVSSAVMHNE